MEDTSYHVDLKFGFFVVLILLVAAIVWGVITTNQKTKLSNELTTAQTSLSSLRSSNSTSKQSCISNAENTYSAPADALMLSTLINTCESEYPTN